MPKTQIGDTWSGKTLFRIKNFQKNAGYHPSIKLNFFDKSRIKVGSKMVIRHGINLC